jgi:hypothetical protein
MADCDCNHYGKGNCSHGLSNTEVLKVTTATSPGSSAYLQHACDPGLVEGHPVANAVAEVLKEHVGEVHKVIDELLADQALVLVLQDLQDGKFTVAAGNFRLVARKFTVSGSGLQSREDCSHTATHLRHVPVRNAATTATTAGLHINVHAEVPELQHVKFAPNSNAPGAGPSGECCNDCNDCRTAHQRSC